MYKIYISFSPNNLHKIGVKEICTGTVAMLQLLFGILPSALRLCIMYNLRSCRSDFEFHVYILLKTVINRHSLSGARYYIPLNYMNAKS